MHPYVNRIGQTNDPFGKARAAIIAAQQAANSGLDAVTLNVASAKLTAAGNTMGGSTLSAFAARIAAASNATKPALLPSEIAQAKSLLQTANNLPIPSTPTSAPVTGQLDPTMLYNAADTLNQKGDIFDQLNAAVLNSYADRISAGQTLSASEDAGARSILSGAGVTNISLVNVTEEPPIPVNSRTSPNPSSTTTTSPNPTSTTATNPTTVKSPPPATNMTASSNAPSTLAQIATALFLTSPFWGSVLYTRWRKK